MKALLAAAFTAVLLVSGGAASVLVTNATYGPKCPKLTYSPDGNVTPLFCKIANPAAVAFYEKLVPGSTSFTSGSPPWQVARAFEAAARAHITPPEACQAYRVFAYRWGWRFTGGSAAVLPSSLSFACRF
jgi:hypothetical protein